MEEDALKLSANFSSTAYSSEWHTFQIIASNKAEKLISLSVTSVPLNDKLKTFWKKLCQIWMYDTLRKKRSHAYKVKSILYLIDMVRKFNISVKTEKELQLF